MLSEAAKKMDKVQLVPRFQWKIEELDPFDDYGSDADQVCIDRLTGREVVRYDLGDPANYAPSHGGWSKDEYLERKGFDPEEEIEVSASMVPVDPFEVIAHSEMKIRASQRDEEEKRGGELHARFPNLDCGPSTGYCNSDYSGDKSYGDWEDEIAAPALEAAGYRDVRFYDIERDSFGPLIRGVKATDAEGVVTRWFYG